MKKMYVVPSLEIMAIMPVKIMAGSAKNTFSPPSGDGGSGGTIGFDNDGSSPVSDPSYMD